MAEPDKANHLVKSHFQPFEMRNAHQSAKKYKDARQGRDGWDGALRLKCSRATLTARENTDTSEQTRALGQPRDRAAPCDARAGQAGCAKAWSCGGPAAKDATKARLETKSKRNHL